MAAPIRRSIDPLPGYRSQEISLFVSQLEDQTRRLREGLEGITPDELQWQPQPGMNTIGMLLAHLAIVEVWWTGIVVTGDEGSAILPTLGINEEADGMPLAEGAAPPAALNGKNLAFYNDLLDRARAYYVKALTPLADADLGREDTRKRPDGTERTVTMRWYLYHVLEHFSGHFGQILLLRHLYKVARVPAKA
jgi:uncharacterized damage-inducible protein DinB